MFYGLEAMDIIVTSIFEALVAAMLIGVWHDVKGRSMPPLEWVPKNKCGVKLVPSNRSILERTMFVGGCAILGSFVGLLIALYFLGFMDKQTIPNAYGRAFVSLLGGFLMPNIFLYLERLKIKGIFSP